MDALLRKRRTLKSKLTRIQSALSITSNNPLSSSLAAQFKDQLSQLWADLNNIHDEVSTLCEDADFDQHQEDFNQQASRIETLRETLAGYTDSGRTSQASGTANVRLPKLQLPTFSGNLHEWASFFDLFTATIHNNVELSGAQRRLQYLKASLRGEAAHLLQSVQVTDANFDDAWDILTKRYHNRREIVNAHIKRLCAQLPVHSDSPSALRKLIDTTNECVRALGVLKVPVSEWDAILVHLVADKIDADSRRQWELSLTSDEIPRFSDFMAFLEQRTRALMTCSSQKSKTLRPITANHSDRKGLLASAHHVVQTSTKACRICSERHPVFRCPTFLETSIDERRAFDKTKSLCFNCLSDQHSVKQCKSGSCRKCNGRHHTLLHTAVSNEVSSVPESEDIVASHYSANRHDDTQSTRVLLATALIKVQDACGTDQVCRALLDTGSQASFVTESCIQRLGMRRFKTNVSVSSLGGAAIGVSRAASKLKITSCIDPRFSLNVDVLILKKVTGTLPSLQCNPSSWSHLQTIRLADPNFHSPSTVDILLGADVYTEVIREGLRRGPTNTPTAQDSALGWLLTGRIPAESNTAAVAIHHVNVDLETSVQRFWELDQVPFSKPLSAEEKKCEEHFTATHRRNPDGRFVVQLPFKTPEAPPVLEGTREIAVHRLKQIERKLAGQPEKHYDYHTFMEEYIALGHMEKISPNDNSTISSIYLPHHAVTRESSSTTRLRVVFDASAKGRTGISLNDHLMVGPTLQEDLFSILIRFRTHIIALTADIAKMYRQIQVDRRDSNYQRIVWRDSNSHPIGDYRLLTVTYGTAAAPYLATRCLQQLANDEATDFPQAAGVILKDFYVDDLMSGANSVEEALKLQRELIELLKRGGFDLRKWSSNNSALLDSVSPNLRETQVPFRIDTGETVKTLGLNWNPASDHFSFCLTPPKSITNNTKRTLLSDMAKVFDPLGWLSPVTVKAKIIFQQLWRTPCNWDDHLPTDLDREWTIYLQDLQAIEAIIINRCLFSQVSTNYQLHGFCDASERAYAAVIYLRSTLQNGNVEVELIAAKTKVAPIKLVTLPRLELCGALLMARLLNSVLQALNFPAVEINAWTDSTITLAWISSSPSRWKTFIANRVVEIQQIIPANRWHHIKGEENPADCASRGINPKELEEHSLWWQGPEWLKKEIQPSIPAENHSAHDITKEERTVLVGITSTPDSMLSRYSSLSTLNRITAYVLRFIHNARVAIAARRNGPLSRDEIDTAFRLRIKKAQGEEFNHDLKCLSTKTPLPSNSRLLSLSPFLDDNGLLRVGGRLRHADLHIDKKFPILLPRKHPLTNLIVHQEHLRNLHAGPQFLLACLQQRFWIIGARDLVRRHVQQCVICCRLRAKTQHQTMGDLPKARITRARPFNKCGVDYAGPFTLRAIKLRGQRTYKAYVALFICLSTRAIHLELVTDLSTDAFISALKRFVARRGNCDEIHSDCGTNFVGANKELKLFLKLARDQGHNEKIARHLAEAGTKWIFNPPAAPNFGGLWEAGVKSVKFHFRRIVGNVTLNFEEMYTILTQIEACLNSRPLCALSSDPDDLAALTPGHFLIGDALTAIPEPDYTALKINRLSRWQLVQKMFQHFWKRWSSEYLSRLQQRPKGWSKATEIKEQDMILLKDDRLPPLKWQLGRVVQIHPGADGLVRVVTVKTENGNFRRPITKLCKLPIDSE